MKRTQALERIRARLTQRDVLTDDLLDVCAFTNSRDVTIGNSASHDDKSRPNPKATAPPPMMCPFGGADLGFSSPEGHTFGLAEVCGRPHTLAIHAFEATFGHRGDLVDDDPHPGSVVVGRMPVRDQQRIESAGRRLP